MNTAQNLLEKIKLDANLITVRYVHESNTKRAVRDQKPELNYTHSSKGVMIEVMKDGFIGYSATNNLSSSGVQTAAEHALNQAKQMSKWGLTQYTEDVRPPSQGKYQSPTKRKFKDHSVGDLAHFMMECTSRLKVSDKISTTSAEILQTDYITEYASTNGAKIEQELNLLSTDLIAIATSGSETHRRSDFGWNSKSHQGGVELLDENTYFERALQIGNQALELLNAKSCPDQKTTLVLNSDQLMLQIHESIGHPLEIDRILGDERNYAGSSFVKIEYGSPLLNATFDPTVKGEFASYDFDDAGLPSEKKYLIKDGTLVRGLGAAESAFRSDLDSVANFRAASWNRAPIDRMANVNIEAGKSTFDEIISNVEDGVFMESNLSWSIDDYRRKFQFGCEYAREIKNGKLGDVLKNPNYRGETTSFWNNLIAVGNEDTVGTFGSPYCGKGEPNQVIRVGHRTPICAFEEIEVFGGQA